MVAIAHRDRMAAGGDRRPLFAVAGRVGAFAAAGARFRHGARRRGTVSAVVAAALLVGAAGLAGAQDLEPRSYVNTPVGMNFLVAGYAYTTGGVAGDPSLPLENASVDAQAALLAYARSFGVLGKSSKVDLILPYGWLDGSATFDGVPHEREIAGLLDPRVRWSVNLYGAPAMGLEEWKGYRQDIIVGASLQMSVPIGQYDSDKLVNLGTNRWFFKPEVGVSKSWGPVSFEVAGAVTLYTDNDAFFNGNRREQDPLFSVQSHLVWAFWRAAWTSLDVTWYGGGQTSVNGVRRDDELSSSRVGLTLALPLSANYSAKLFGSTGVSTRTGTDFDTVGLALQYRWGGGL